MSLNPKERRSHTAEANKKRTEKKIDLSVFEKIGEKANNNNSLINPSNSINPNNSVVFNSDTVFKKRIDKLNIKFYFESEKFLNSKSETERSQDQLYVILFKQISLYIEEVERLSNLLKEKIEDEKILKEKLEELMRNEKDKNYSFNLVKHLKNEVLEMQKKLEEKNKNEEKFKREIDNLKRNLNTYEEKIKKIENVSKNCFNENSIVITANKKKNQNYNGDSFRKNQNSAASTKSNTGEFVVKKLRVEDFLTYNTSGKNYFEEDSYANNKNNIRSSVISNEDEKKLRGAGAVNNSELFNQGTSIQSINQTNNKNINSNQISLSNNANQNLNSNNLGNNYGNKNNFTFQKSLISSAGIATNSKSNDIQYNNNYNSNSFVSIADQMTNLNLTSSFSNNICANSKTKDFKIIKSIKQKNKSNSQDSLITNKILPNAIRIEGEENNQKSQSLQINLAISNPITNNTSCNSSYNNQIHLKYLNSLEAEMNYLIEIEQDISRLIKFQKEITNENNPCSHYSDVQTENKIPESNLSDEEFYEGYRSGPCFYKQNNSSILEKDYFRSSSNEKNLNNNQNIKRSFVNSGVYPITTTIYLDVGKKDKTNISNTTYKRHPHNKNTMVSSSPNKNRLNINYLKKAKAIK